jgi:predicted Zn-dependent peptidase
VAAAGAVDHGEVVERVQRGFGECAAGSAPRRSPPPAVAAAHEVIARPTEQAHLALAWSAPSRTDPDRYAVAVLDQLLGGGMASRLFQEIREERGLAYSVYSYHSGYADGGAMGVYAGTNPGQVDELLDLIDEEVSRLVADGPDDRELAVARGCLAGSLVLGLDDSAGCMSRLAKAEMTWGTVASVEEELEGIAAVQARDVSRVLDRIFNAPRVSAVLGPDVSGRAGGASR